MSSKQARARNLIFISGILWSLAGVGIKTVQAPAMTVAAYRSFFAALALAPFLRGRLKTFSWKPLAVGDPFLMMAALSYTGIMVTFVAATKMTFAANAIVLQYTAPVFIFLFNRTIFKPWKEAEVPAPDKKDVAVLAGCMAGIFIIFFGQTRSLHLTGIFLALLSSVCFAFYIGCVEKLRKADPVVIVFTVNLFASILIFTFGQRSLVLPQKDLFLLFFLGAFQLGLPYLLFNIGLKQVRSEEASLIVLIEPLLNPLWVALKFQEVPTAATFIGGACILLTLALRYLPNLKWKKVALDA